ncbi:MAG: hypothetical protein AAF934_02170 [Bacteroidota bacterium]
MNTKLKILLAVILLTSVLTREKIYEHPGFGLVKPHSNPTVAKNGVETSEKIEAETGNYLINDSLYRWNEQLLDWIPIKEMPEYQTQLVTYNKAEHPAVEPIEIAWKELMNIRYQLRYFSELDMEIYAPVFPEAIKALDGKEISIEGFIIPFDEAQEVLALSANPYASCFFCGKASPASVMSIHLKDKRKRYKMDDFKKLRGSLHLNHDDPKEFYYILRNAKEE